MKYKIITINPYQLSIIRSLYPVKRFGHGFFPTGAEPDSLIRIHLRDPGLVYRPIVAQL